MTGLTGYFRSASTRRLLRWSGYLTIFATSVSLYDRLWLFELFTHFTVQYIAVLILLTGIFVLYRQFGLACLFAVFLCINLYKFHLHSIDDAIASTPLSSQRIKVAVLNVDFNSTRYPQVEAFIQDYQADILLLTELTPEWLDNLQVLDAIYPYSYLVPKRDGFGIALFSRFPLSNSRTVSLDDPRSPAIFSQILVDETSILVGGVHLFAPMTNYYFHARNRQLNSLAEMLKDEPTPVIVLGDFNVTSWSSFFQDFIETTSLTISTAGQGLQPTWPSYFFPFYIQLDHILVSKEFSVVSSKSESYVGSDHFPLVAEILIPSR